MDETTRNCYEQKVGAWLAVEAIVRQLDKEKTAQAMAKLSSGSADKQNGIDLDGDIDNDVFEENGFSDLSDPEDYDEEHCEREKVIEKPDRLNKSSTDSGNVADEDVVVEKMDHYDDDAVVVVELHTIGELDTDAEIVLVDSSTPEVTGECELAVLSEKSSPSTSSYETVANDFNDTIEPFNETEPLADHAAEDDSQIITISSSNRHSVIITNASIDIVNGPGDANGDDAKTELTPLQEEVGAMDALETLQEPKSACVSPASSGGGVYSVSRGFNSSLIKILRIILMYLYIKCKLLDSFGLNLNRIEKDVLRCDRNYWYFANKNLDKLRNVICT